MRPVTVAELTQRMTEASDSVLAGTRVTSTLGVVSMMLVLKRASDQPGILHIPDWMQWHRVIEMAGDRDASRQLYEAMKELEQCNPDFLNDVFESLDFPVEAKWTDVETMISYFSQISLRDEDLEFPEVIGEAYSIFLERMIGIVSRRETERETPKWLADLMVRLIRLGSGQSICDPFAGTAGTLIAANGYVFDQDEDSLEVYGQELDRYQWAAAKLNLLLHGISNTKLLHGDSLRDPRPMTADGSLMRFDRVLGRQTLGRSYQQNEVRHPERMKYGWTSGRGRADLMFVQHALAVLRPGGVGAVISPQGVLFRGGAEAEIRRGIVEDNRIMAVISLGPNIFQSTSVPACILVLQGEGRRESRGGTVIFIDAEQEMVAGRAQRRLGPESSEKIIDVFESGQDLQGFSRVVSLAEIADNDFNLSVRGYVEAGQSVEPSPDAAAIISGGMPRAEVETEAGRFRAFGIDPSDLFEVRNVSYLDFPSGGYRAKMKEIPVLATTREEEFASECQLWWAITAPDMVELAAANHLLRSRSRLIDSFRTQLSLMGILDAFQLNGVFAIWWSARYEDLRILNRSGFQAVLNRWNTVTADRSSRLSEAEARERVLTRLGADLCVVAQSMVAGERQKLVDVYRSWGERYATSLASLEAQREAAVTRLRDRLRHLGYEGPSPF